MGYALAVAAQADDWRDRELGPIHLLKYLYLADLEYARSHGGESFSGIGWWFHKFGPWAVEAFQQIEPAMAALRAERREFTSRYRDDNVRWKLPPDQLENRESGLPSEVARALSNAVREFGSDTSALLHHVYRTEPMLRAAPGDRLELPGAEPEPEQDPAPPAPAPTRLSKTKVKKMREEMRRRLNRKRESRRTVAPDPPPRYDEVFARGVAWLDGPEAEVRSGRVSFSRDVWTSRARGDSELP